MPQPANRPVDLEWANETDSLLAPLPGSHEMYVYSVIDDRHNQPPVTQPPHLFYREPDYGDGSWPLFSMYSRVTADEDNNVARRWQKDSQGIMLFVSPCECLQTTQRVNLKTTDWFILCHRRGIACSNDPGPQAKPSGHHRILSPEHLPALRRQLQRISGILPFHRG